MSDNPSTYEFDFTTIILLSLVFPPGSYLVQAGFINLDWYAYLFLIFGIVLVVFSVALVRNPIIEIVGGLSLIAVKTTNVVGGFTWLDFSVATGISGLFMGGALLSLIVLAGGFGYLVFKRAPDPDTIFVGDSVKGAIGSNGLNLLVSITLAGSLFFTYALWNIPLSPAPKAGIFLTAIYWISVQSGFLFLLLLSIKALLITSLRYSFAREFRGSATDIKKALAPLPSLIKASFFVAATGVILTVGFYLYGASGALSSIAFGAVGFAAVLCLVEFLFIAKPSLSFSRVSIRTPFSKSISKNRTASAKSRIWLKSSGKHREKNIGFRAILLRGAGLTFAIILFGYIFDEYYLQERSDPMPSSSDLVKVVQREFSNYNEPSKTASFDYYPKFIIENLQVKNIARDGDDFTADVNFDVVVKNTKYMNMSPDDFWNFYVDYECRNLSGRQKTTCRVENNNIRISMAIGKTRHHFLEDARQEACKIFYRETSWDWARISSCRVHENQSAQRSVSVRFFGYDENRSKRGLSGFYARLFGERRISYLIATRLSGENYLRLEQFFHHRDDYNSRWRKK